MQTPFASSSPNLCSDAWLSGVLLSLGPSFLLELRGSSGAVLSLAAQPWAPAFKPVSRLGAAGGLAEPLDQHLTMFLVQFAGRKRVPRALLQSTRPR